MNSTRPVNEGSATGQLAEAKAGKRLARPTGSGTRRALGPDGERRAAVTHVNDRHLRSGRTKWIAGNGLP
jgi:hypothetical protein